MESYPRLGFRSAVTDQYAGNGHPFNKMLNVVQAKDKTNCQIWLAARNWPHLFIRQSHVRRAQHIRFFSLFSLLCRTLNYVAMFSVGDLLNGHAIGIGAVLVLLYVVGGAIYRLYLSPLAKFPGPKVAALTLWYSLLSGLLSS
jgi:hypothetical protein